MTNDQRMLKSEPPDAHAPGSFWHDGAGVVCEEPETKRVYDLEERTARFGEGIIDFAKTIPQNPVTSRIINQLGGAATPVGANYVEADDAVSKRNFLKSIGTCQKEARETKRSGSSRTETASSDALALSKGAASDFLQHLEKQMIRMMTDEGMTKLEQRDAKCLCHSRFVLHSSFDIRISAFLRS